MQGEDMYVGVNISLILQYAMIALNVLPLTVSAAIVLVMHMRKRAKARRAARGR